MIVDRTYNIELIASVMFDDYVFDVMSEDGATKESQRFDVYEHCWLKAVVDGELIGLYHLIPRTGSTLEAHLHVLKEHRKEHARAGILKAYEWVLNNTDESMIKINALIPENHNNVLNFTLNNGFIHEGVNRKSHVKNNEIYDVNMVGITREEMKEVLNG
jgi:RimJ/RimL family protein N-acetyltransferase